jgi:hypothetical protein
MYIHSWLATGIVDCSPCIRGHPMILAQVLVLDLVHVFTDPMYLALVILDLAQSYLYPVYLVQVSGLDLVDVQVYYNQVLIKDLSMRITYVPHVASPAIDTGSSLCVVLT